MKSIIRIVAGLALLLVIVPAALVGVFFVTFDAEAFKTEITKQISVALARDVSVKGPVGLSFDNGVSLNLKDVHVSNPEGFKEKTFLSIGELNVAVNVAALAQRQIDVRSISLKTADINLVTSAGGVQGWAFPVATKSVAVPSAAAPAPGPQSGKSPQTQAGENPLDEAFSKAADEAKATFRIEKVAVNDIAISNANVTVIDERSGKVQKVSIGKASVSNTKDGTFNLAMLGLFEEKAFEVKLAAPKGLQALAAGSPTPVDIATEFDGSRYQLKGQFAHKDNTFSLTEMAGRIRDVDVTGELGLSMAGAAPKVTGRLVSPHVVLQDLLPPSAPKAAARVQSLVLVAAHPLKATLITSSVPNLKGLDADVKIRVTRFVLPEGRELNDLRTRIDLSAGHLRLVPILANFQGVPYEASFDFMPSGNDAISRIGLKASGVNFKELAKAFGSTSPLDAKGDIFVDLTGNGLAPDVFKNTMRGRIELAIGKGGLDLSGGGATAVNLIKMLYPKTQLSEKQNINCAAMRFDLANGVMKTDGLLLDSPLAAVAGEGTIDIVRDSVNLLFRHAVKDEQAGGFLNVPIRATGTLANLSYGPDEKAVVERAASIITGGGAVSTGVPRVDMAVQGKNPCVAALQNPQPIMLKQMKPQEAVKATINQATDAYKAARDKVKDALKGGDPAKPEGGNPLDAIKGLMGR